MAILIFKRFVGPDPSPFDPHESGSRELMDPDPTGERKSKFSKIDIFLWKIVSKLIFGNPSIKKKKIFQIDNFYTI